MTEEVPEAAEEAAEEAKDQPTCVYVKGHKLNAMNSTHHEWGEYHTIVVPESEVADLLKKKDHADHPSKLVAAKKAG